MNIAKKGDIAAAMKQRIVKNVKRETSTPDCRGQDEHADVHNDGHDRLGIALDQILRDRHSSPLHPPERTPLGLAE